MPNIFSHFWVVFRMPCEQQDHEKAEHPVYAVVWDNAGFPLSPGRGVVRHQTVWLPNIPTFPHPIKQIFSARPWKSASYERQSSLRYHRCQRGLRHTRGFSLHACDLPLHQGAMLRPNESPGFDFTAVFRWFFHSVICPLVRTVSGAIKNILHYSRAITGGCSICHAAHCI